MQYGSTALVSACLGLWAMAAQATCPTAADLGGGIALVRTEPFYSNVMTSTPSGLSEARVMSRDGVPEAVSSTYSHALTVTSRTSSNGVLELSYADDPGVLDELPRIGSWATGVTLTSDGEVQNTGTFTARYIASFPLELGECTYETWQVHTSLALEGRAPILMDSYYAPSLGIALASVTLDADGNAISGVIYDDITAQ